MFEPLQLQLEILLEACFFYRYFLSCSIYSFKDRMSKNFGCCTCRQEQEAGFRIEQAGSKTGVIISDRSRNQDGQLFRLELAWRCHTEYRLSGCRAPLSYRGSSAGNRLTRWTQVCADHRTSREVIMCVYFCMGPLGDKVLCGYYRKSLCTGRRKLF